MNKVPKLKLGHGITPTSCCVRIGNLRVVYDNDDISLKIWMQDPDNLYVGRSGRIFIYYPYIGPEMYHYKSSKWHNPFKVGTVTGKYTLEESLKLYRQHIIDSGLVNDL